jgi:hypothetical protein
MRWDQTEFLLKGIYLGLLLMVALHGPGWAELVWVGLFSLGGLTLSLAAAGRQQWNRGHLPRGWHLSYLLFLLLENPGKVYTGLIAGLALGAYVTFRDQSSELDLWAVGGGAALGAVMYALRNVRRRSTRLYLGLSLAVVLAGAAFTFSTSNRNCSPPSSSA